MKHVDVLRQFATSFALVLFGGCAATDPATLRRIELTKGVGPSAKSCCESIAGPVSRAALLDVNQAEFSPETEHFDMGMGLAPIQTFRLGDATRVFWNST